METFSFKHELLVFMMLLIPIYAFSQRDYWNDRRRVSNNRQQVIKRNMQSWEQQQRSNRQETYNRNSQQRRNVQQDALVSGHQRQESSRASNNVSSQETEISNTTLENEKVVSLVVNGNGKTKEKAIQNALRSAIEQAFGTFVSANTEVLNDELIKDEIATVASGNIKSYKELSIDQDNGLYDVTVQTLVSIDQLTQFAQSRGMQAELAGATFVMNMKMRELNKKNELVAMTHMEEKVKSIAQKGLFDYKLRIDEPFLVGNSEYAIAVTIYFVENDNTREFYRTIYNTYKELRLNKKEIEDYRKANINYFVYDDQLIYNTGKYVLRNFYKGISPLDYKNVDYLYSKYMAILMESALNYEIKDNIGKKWYCRRVDIDDMYAEPEWERLDRNKDKQIVWYYEDINIKGKKSSHYYILHPRVGVPKHFSYISRVGGIEMFIPITDKYSDSYSAYFNVNDIRHLNFNPLLVRDGYFYTKTDSDKNDRSFYKQSFYLLYTESELSKLSSITIEYRHK